MAIAVARRSISSLSARLFPPSRPFCLVCFQYTVFPYSSLSAGRQSPSVPAICCIARNLVSSWTTMYRKPHLLASGMPMMQQFRHSIMGKPAGLSGRKKSNVRAQRARKEASCLSPDDIESSEDDSDVIRCIKKYNLLKHHFYVDAVLKMDGYLRNCFCPYTIVKHSRAYKWELGSFQSAFICNLFMEHLVKYFSHSQVQEVEARYFAEVFTDLTEGTLIMIAKDYCRRCIAYRHEELPQGFRAVLLKETEKKKEELRNEYRKKIPDEMMREIEDHVIQELDSKLTILRNLNKEFQLV